MKWRIKAYRSSLSIFGAAQAWLKDINGQVIEFETVEQAIAEAGRLNRELSTSNVNYQPAPAE